MRNLILAGFSVATGAHASVVKLGFGDVVGLESAKDALQKYSTEDSERIQFGANSEQIPVVLLSGSRGMGKSLLAKTFAAETKKRFYVAQGGKAILVNNAEQDDSNSSAENDDLQALCGAANGVLYVEDVENKEQEQLVRFCRKFGNRTIIASTAKCCGQVADSSTHSLCVKVELPTVSFWTILYKKHY